MHAKLPLLHSSLTALALSMSLAAARANVLVVHPSAGPYTTIQAAVDAAVDGDVVLVKSTGFTYTGFSVNDKALTIVGDLSPTTSAPPRINRSVSVTSLSATRTLVLAQLRIELPSRPTPEFALSVANVSGQLRVQRCTLVGAEGQWVDDPNDPGGYGMGSDAGHGVVVQNCSGGIAFGACTFTGGTGGMVGGTGADRGGHGGHGVVANDARIAMYDCVVRGGRGGDGSFIGADGGTAMICNTGASPRALLASNSSFTGGMGGMGEDLGYFCRGPGGDGGDGLRIESGSLAITLDGSYVGGLANCGTPPPASNGQAITNNGSLVALGASHVQLEAPVLVRAQTTMQFSLRADPGDQLFLFTSTRTSFVGLVSWRGFWLAKPARLTPQLNPPLPFVTLPGSGQVNVTVPAPYLEPGQQERTEFVQVYRVTPSGSLTLGSFVPITVIAPGF